VQLEGDADAERDFQIPPPERFGTTAAERGNDRSPTAAQRGEEMQPLVAQARKSGGAVAIEVYLNRRGEPFLIHMTKEKVTNVINGKLLP
jgi:hypothetical protein